ncbi:hypothetical protein BC834DRAFT_827414, partial [Gloeopeniophorella convolvens]
MSAPHLPSLAFDPTGVLILKLGPLTNTGLKNSGFSASSIEASQAASVSGSPTPDSHVRTQEELDRIVSALDSLKTNIKRHRNSLSPIAKLFPEILSQIFERHTEMDPPLLGWLLDTHVCHRWRQVAISHAALWGRIPFVLGWEWLQVSLSRARSAGLTMQYSIP